MWAAESRRLASAAESPKPSILVSCRLAVLHHQHCLPATAACMHLALPNKAPILWPTPVADLCVVTCHGILPVIIELILSVMDEAHKGSLISNGLQALLMTTG